MKTQRSDTCDAQHSVRHTAAIWQQTADAQRQDFREISLKGGQSQLYVDLLLSLPSSCPKEGHDGHTGRRAQANIRRDVGLSPDCGEATPLLDRLPPDFSSERHKKSSDSSKPLSLVSVTCCQTQVWPDVHPSLAGD